MKRKRELKRALVISWELDFDFCVCVCVCEGIHTFSLEFSTKGKPLPKVKGGVG